MNVDLLPIINNEGEKLSFDGQVDFSCAGCLVHCDVSGEALNFAGRIDVSANVKAVVQTACARCLKPVTVNINVDVFEAVGEEEVALDGTVLDISSVVEDNVIVELPIRFLCSDDCNGICGRCGADLNSGSCDCSDDEIDERFAGLKDLLE